MKDLLREAGAGKRWWIWLLLLVLALLLAACQSAAEPSDQASLDTPEPVGLAEAVAPAASSTATSAATQTQAPTATQTQAPTATATATAMPEPTATATPTPTPARWQLTDDGCCTRPFWGPDSRQVLFIDKPAPDGPVGFYSVSIDRPPAEPALVTTRIADYTPDFQFLVERGDNATTIERIADISSSEGNERWTVRTGGGSVVFSPDSTRIAWQVNNGDGPVEQRISEVWVANLDGSEARRVATLPRGGLSGWIDDETLLISGQESLQTREQYYAALSLVDGSPVELARAQRVRGASISPNGRWLVYMISLNDDEPALNGLWLMRTDGSERRQLPRELFGAYQWRAGSRLLIVPFLPDARFHEFLELDADSGDVRRLINSDVTPLKIANGDWRISPDGRYVVYVESSDRNVWVVGLPG